MAMIAPTVESIGDEALTNSIIDRSITELQDDLITSLPSYALMGATNLKKAVFASVTMIDESTFGSCPNLEVVDFHSQVTLKGYPFYKSQNLKAVIFRHASRSVLNNAGAFSNSGIGSSGGYIYVPNDYLASYQAGWSAWKDYIRAIEDYPEVCDPYSWEAVAKNIENGAYKSVYKIGDTVPLDLGSEGIINMEIVAFDADTLADGSGTAAISWVAKDLLATMHRMNPGGSTTEGTGTVGGWDKCEMRTYLKDTIRPLVPADVSSMIQSVAKTQDAYNTSGSKVSQTTADELWIPHSGEWYAGIYAGSSLHDQTGRVKCVPGGTSASSWWTRQAGNRSCFFQVKASGAVSADTGANSEMRVCIGFCTGVTPT